MYPIAQLLNAALDTNASACRPALPNELVPRTNILESEQDYRIVTDLPGVRNEDLDISLEDDVLTIKAERSQEVPEGYSARRRELIGKATFRRSFTLGHAVNAEAISAKLDTGVLTITLPKSDRAVPRRIEVK
ncbi:MAG: Hsp20/alpha crystallin family protein [Candidatus Krumholzibacteriia bacterium]